MTRELQQTLTAGGASATMPVHVPEEQAGVLQAILEGTVRSTGGEFFQTLVKNLAAAMNVQYAFVAEFREGRDSVRTLALWTRDHIADNVEYALPGTPCEDVIRGSLCHHPRGVAGLFPGDAMLAELGIESYLGVPLLDRAGEVLGHLAVMDVQPMPQEPTRAWIFRIFAERATAELERLRMEEKLEASERQFRELFDEAPIAYVYEDSDTRFINVNRSGMRLLGLKPEDVPGTMGMSLVAPNQVAQEQVHGAFADIRQGKERGFMELELRRKDDGRPMR